MNKIGFIGGGKMATAIIKGIINAHLCSSDDIVVSDRNEDTLNYLGNTYNVTTTLHNREVIKNAKIILFAVKPFVLKDVLNEIKPFLTKEHVILSIAAGISINSIEEIAGEIPVIRIMPNTPALVNEGMSAICKGTHATYEHTQIALEIFSKVGKVIEANEKDIDTITAISGSGPAFYYYLINEIAKAGEKLGLDYKTSLLLSAQTALGASKMIMKGDVSPEQLIINVTTPGGCTEVGNNILQKGQISEIIFDTIDKTAKKAYELGKN